MLLEGLLMLHHHRSQRLPHGLLHSLKHAMIYFTAIAVF
jgi:hypothetical protein